MKILRLLFLLVFNTPIITVWATYDNANSYQNGQDLQDPNMMNGMQSDQSTKNQIQSGGLVNKERIHGIVDDILGVDSGRERIGKIDRNNNSDSYSDANVQEFVDDIKQALKKFSGLGNNSHKNSSSDIQNSQRARNARSDKSAQYSSKDKQQTSRKMKKIYTVKNVPITKYNTTYANKQYAIKTYGSKHINMHDTQITKPIKYEIKTYGDSHSAAMLIDNENSRSTKKLTVKKHVGRFSRKIKRGTNYFKPGKCCGA